jgi:hypothetical protein
MFPHVRNLHNERLAAAFIEDSERLSIAVRNLELDIQLHVSSEKASIKTFNKSLYLRVRLLFHTDETFSKSGFGQRSFPVNGYCLTQEVVQLVYRFLRNVFPRPNVDILLGEDRGGDHTIVVVIKVHAHHSLLVGEPADRNCHSAVTNRPDLAAKPFVSKREDSRQDLEHPPDRLF